MTEEDLRKHVEIIRLNIIREQPQIIVDKDKTPRNQRNRLKFDEEKIRSPSPIRSFIPEDIQFFLTKYM